jgi:primosomal protein N' (replication factor Y)
MFAEVILPLPLYSSFTYLIPPEMEENISIGSRVLVQFGRKKFYTGIVSLIHNEISGSYTVFSNSTAADSMRNASPSFLSSFSSIMLRIIRPN